MNTSRKIVVKRLKASDLTFFQWQNKNNSSNQKSINLNANIFVDVLYPGLRNDSKEKYQLDTFLYGPGLEGEYNLQRKIVKSLGSKNWRLNGETVPNPEEHPDRFNALQEMDFAIFDFNEGIIPVSVKIVFIAAVISEDRDLHQALDLFISGKSMVALSPMVLEEMVKVSNLVPEHPVHGLLLDTNILSPEIEDIALGGRGTAITRSSTKKLSHNDFLKAREGANLVGRQGEIFVNSYLAKLKATKLIDDFEWTSDKNAISSYDFLIVYDGITRTLVDVKSTQGEFERPLHISYNELLRMREGPEKYNIYRIFDIKETTAQLRIAEDVGGWADSILRILSNLPEGVSSDGISVLPSILPFGTANTVELEEQAEEQ